MSVIPSNHRSNDAAYLARSNDFGATLDPTEHILGEGKNYPGGIAQEDGTLITISPPFNQGPIQAAHWQPLPRRG